MQDSSFRVLFLGDDLAWSKVAQALVDAPRLNLRIHRAQSLNELLLVLAGGQWHAAAVDLQAWNFQGLQYVDKIRSEYPALPILALFPASSAGLAIKCKNSAASRCLPLETLTAEGIHLAIISCLSDKKSDSPLRKVPPMQVTFNIPDNAPLDPSKTRVISHALNNLLCVITANADILEEHVGLSGPGTRSLAEIKKAVKSASDLTRLLQ